MCSGRVDPALIFRAFQHGADGVMVGACLPGECHYTSGNVEAAAKIRVVQRVLSELGLDVNRAIFRMMSSAEGDKFVQYVSEYVDYIHELGPLGAEAAMDRDRLQRKLTAARRAMEGKKLRWVLGKQTEFMEKGNLYGERFSRHEIDRMFWEIVKDECAIQEIWLVAHDRPLSVTMLAAETGLPTSRVMRHLADMERMGLVAMERIEGRSPLWRSQVGTEMVSEAHA